MRVAIDARSAISPEKTGVGHYTWNLIHHLPTVDPGTTYVAWYPHTRRLLGRPLVFQDVRASNFEERWSVLPGRAWQRLGDRFGMPRVEWFVRFDVFFATNFVPPPTRAPVVTTVHDLAYRLYPETAGHATSMWLRKVDETVRRAARILVPSDSTKRDITELYPVDPSRVTVTHLGVDLDAFLNVPPAAMESVLARYAIDRPYFVFLGGIERRKNLPRLVEAFSRIPTGVALVIAGGAVPWSPEGQDDLRTALAAMPSEARERVVLTGYVAHGEKAALLHGALALVYPSLYEGFGLPVAEALACGTPVLTSNVSALPEVAGDAALLVEPEDVRALADGLQRLVEDEALRARLSKAGRTRAPLFTWEGTARKTAQALLSAGQDG